MAGESERDTERLAGDTEAERYKQAAEDALQQLDWVIGYLHGIRKTQLSAKLAQNRTYIKRNLMKEPTRPLPSTETGET